ncbi:MAG: protein-tyrosine-phosphatase [Cyclobacteriaceae bacterium]
MNYIKKVLANFDSISEERKAILEQVSAYIKEQLETRQKCHLTFICTHNSRRSHLSQIWAQVAAYYYDLPVVCFSAGTEATAFNHHAIQAIVDAGLSITTEDVSDNPKYLVTYNKHSFEAFSKTMDHFNNPTSNFAALMTCDHVDENCPIVPGTDIRIPLHYVDPKKSDGTGKEKAVYGERCFEIATELFYVFDSCQ